MILWSKTSLTYTTYALDPSIENLLPRHWFGLLKNQARLAQTTDQRTLTASSSVRKETSHIFSKVPTAKNVFSGVYVIGTACFDLEESFFKKRLLKHVFSNTIFMFLQIVYIKWEHKNLVEVHLTSYLYLRNLYRFINFTTSIFTNFLASFFQA